ncbi:hypothetical protein HF526_20730 [Pseudonocardia sp. K10HN5]|uniref:PNPLA domain-containing protein n=1 Tax=Pseudonocardia acidicola TaxID=2724939 RepID=A0ABX1SFP4_9PSEU|nr:hypothetical protein [Pseudonocardia acidicola]
MTAGPSSNRSRPDPTDGRRTQWPDGTCRAALPRPGPVAGVGGEPGRAPPLARRRRTGAGGDGPGTDRAVPVVDARSGEFRAFDRTAGAPLVEAVAASCAVPGIWPPITTGGSRWIDGGVRSVANADLAAGYDRVVVLAPLTRGFGPVVGVDAQVETLRARFRVAVVSPDDAARHAIGRTVLDPAHRAFSARAGRAQARAAAAAVREVWAG